MKERLLEQIRRQQLMRAGDRVGVAVSGGADSVALLRMLLEIRGELGVVLSVVHFNHRLRGEESDQDEAFVRELASAHELEFFRAEGDTRACAAERKCGIEAAARELRYAYFWGLLSPRREKGEYLSPQGYAEENRSPQGTQGNAGAGRTGLDRIATAHTLDDQAETVLLRFLRGAGTRGLAGVHPVVGENKRSLDCARDDKSQLRAPGEIVRPLLGFRRAQLRHYLRRAGQEWREDASNLDPAFARNKARSELLPKMREFNPAIEEVLAETAEIARAEEEYWRERVQEVLEEITTEDTKGHEGKQKVPRLGLKPSLGMTKPSSLGMTDTAKLREMPVALRRRVVREMAERAGARLEFRHVQQVLELAMEEPSRAQRVIELPQGMEARVIGHDLLFQRRPAKARNDDYELELPVPGEVPVEAAGVRIRAKVASEGARLKAAAIKVRNWRPGDRYWPAHTATPKKVKELLQDRRVPAEARAHWPVVVAGEEIVWVPGFAYPEKWMEENGEGLVLEWEMDRG